MATKTDAQKEAELRAVGWTPSQGDSVQAAYQRTATVADGGGQPNVATPQASATSTDAATKASNEAAVLAGFKESSGFSREQLAESARQFNATLAQKQLEWQQQGLPALIIQQKSQALEDEKYRSDLALAQQAQAQSNALSVAGLTGYYNAPTGPGYNANLTMPGAAAGAASGPVGPTPPVYLQYAQGNQALADQRYAADVVKAQQQAGGGAAAPVPGSPTAADYAALPAATQATYAQYNGGAAGGQAKWLADATAAFQAAGGGAPPAASGVTVNGAPVSQGQGVQTLAGNQQQFNQNMANSQQGLDYLKYASSLNGPADVFNNADFLRGANARGDVPTFLSALGSNTQLPSFVGAGSVAQTPLTAGGTAASLTGAGGMTSTGYSTDDALAQIGSIFKKGPTGLASGTIERMNPSELAIFKAGGAKLGYNADDWLKTYGASGVGQAAGV